MSKTILCLVLMAMQIIVAVYSQIIWNVNLARILVVIFIVMTLKKDGLGQINVALYVPVTRDAHATLLSF